MVEIKEVASPSQQKAFVEFPLRLYAGNDCFVPPLYADEMKLFRKDYHYYDDAEAVYYLAYRGKEVVVRISGILQRRSNEKWKQKRVRFTRFDAINDGEVAAVLIEDDATLKKVYHKPYGLLLMPANENYEPQIYTPDQLLNIRIMGKAVAFLSPVE